MKTYICWYTRVRNEFLIYVKIEETDETFYIASTPHERFAQHVVKTLGENISKRELKEMGLLG